MQAGTAPGKLPPISFNSQLGPQTVLEKIPEIYCVTMFAHKVCQKVTELCHTKICADLSMLLFTVQVLSSLLLLKCRYAGMTNQLTGVGARDAYASKKSST